MAALINALDNYTPKQIGENGHVEYGWSNDIREKILQYSFQLVRTSTDSNLKSVLKDMLTILKCQSKSVSTVEKELARGYLSMLYRMIGHTRDIIDGKGEYNLTYMMICVWYDFFPELAKFALKCLVDLGDRNIHQYGSWKDIKYFCDYVKTETGNNIHHPLIFYAVKLVNNQISKDYEKLLINSNEVSLTAKWVPREKSSFGWLYEQLATDHFVHIVSTATNSHSIQKAILKCKTEYRKVLSALNRKIDTLQIKQCGKVWSTIDFNRVTSISITKQKKAFLNVKSDGEVRFPDITDRVQCAENFSNHVQSTIKNCSEIKGKRVGMADFTKQALELIRGNNNQVEKDILNSQWRDNARQTGALGKMIAMVDVSGSMDGDPMNVAIALGLRIAEKSVLGKRVMTFSAKPTWVKLDGYNDFVSQVNVVKDAEWGMNTNFNAALDLILNAIIENKMAAEDVQDMILVILSDMQMDSGDTCNKQVLYDTMKAKYEAAGIRVQGAPYKPPHILFWNLSSSSGFPSLSNQPNCSMMSGFSPALLNLFCDQGLDALQACTPWFLLEKSLANDRYTIMSNRLSQEFE
jgi:Mg-chelatase subunit ChlD